MKLLFVLLTFLGCFALDNVTVPNAFVSGQVIQSSKINGNFDSLKNGVNRLKDSISNSYMRKPVYGSMYYSNYFSLNSGSAFSGEKKVSSNFNKGLSNQVTLDTAKSNLVFQVAGTYLITYSFASDIIGTTQNYYARCHHNTSIIADSWTWGYGYPAGNVIESKMQQSFTRTFAVNDSLSIWFNTTASATVTIYGLNITALKIGD